MEKYKILFVVPQMDFSDESRTFLSLVRAIDYSRYDADVLIAKKGGALENELPEKIRIIESPGYGEFFASGYPAVMKAAMRDFGKKSPASFFRTLQGLARSKKDKNFLRFPDLRFLSGYLKYVPEFDASGYDAVFSCFGHLSDFYTAYRVRSDNKILWLRYERPVRDFDAQTVRECRGRFKRIIAPSESIFRDFSSSCPELSDRLCMLPYPFDPQRVRDLALLGPEFKDGFFSGRRILSCGRLDFYKGFDQVIPAVRKLTDDDYTFRWYIIGNGDEKDKLISSIMEIGVPHMIFFIDGTQNIYSYIRDCDIVVVPSRYDGVPEIIKEAKALFKPVISTDFVSAGELLGDGELGMICKNSAQDIYSSVRRLIDEYETCDRYTEKLSEKMYETSPSGDIIAEAAGLNTADA